MPTEVEIRRLHPKGRARLCICLSKTMPPLPSEIEAELGATNLVLINSVLLALESVADDAGEDLDNLSLGLSTIVAVAERKAHEIEAREYQPGNNYGFSGAADTYGEIYRYLSAYVRTIANAVVLDVEACISAFRGALRLYAIYSAHGDPKGAIAREIEEAEDRSETTILEAYASIPQEWKDFHEEELPPSSPGHPPRQVITPRPGVSKSSIVEEPASVFVSFKNLDAQGEETKDCQVAKRVARFLRKEGISVFFSLDSLERLGTSAYKKAIDKALDDAKILVAVGTSRKRLESEWVRYEWDSFLNDMMSGVKPEGRIFAVVEGVATRDLPRGLRQHQAFGSDDSALRKLTNFIQHSLGQ